MNRFKHLLLGFVAATCGLAFGVDRARACSVDEPPTTVNNTTPIPPDGVVLLSSSRPITVLDPSGAEVPGSVNFEQTWYWVADEPLEPGTYTLWSEFDVYGDSPPQFVVSDELMIGEPELSWSVDATRETAPALPFCCGGDDGFCEPPTCFSLVDRDRLRLEVQLQWPEDTPREQFVVVATRDRWSRSCTGCETLEAEAVTHESSPEYEVSLEAIRIVDGAIFDLGSVTIEHFGGELKDTPVPVAEALAQFESEHPEFAPCRPDPVAIDLAPFCASMALSGVVEDDCAALAGDGEVDAGGVSNSEPAGDEMDAGGQPPTTKDGGVDSASSDGPDPAEDAGDVRSPSTASVEDDPGDSMNAEPGGDDAPESRLRGAGQADSEGGGCSLARANPQSFGLPWLLALAAWQWRRSGKQCRWPARSLRPAKP